MDRALRIVPHANSRVTLLAKGQFSARRALACFEISLTALYLSPVLDAQRKEGPELDDTIPKKKGETTISSVQTFIKRKLL